MTPEKLQDILRSTKGLSLNEIKEIIWELKKDCFNEYYKLTEATIPNISKDEQDGMTVFRATMQNVGKEQYYMGEINAFYICLDLLNKLEIKRGIQ